jgi:AmmeMemoRadiSam system protein A
MGKIASYYAMPHPPIIVPEVGKGEEAAIKDTSDAFDKAAKEIADIKPDVIIIVTPHGPLFRDAVALSCEMEIQGDLARFRAPGAAFRAAIDIPLTEAIIRHAESEGIPSVRITQSSARQYGVKYELDHGTMVPLSFINKQYREYRLVHITYGLLPKMQLYRFGMCIAEAVEESGLNAVIIASGDLSHRLTKDGPYEYSPDGERFDREIAALLEKGDVPGIFDMDPVLIENAGECALRSYYVLLGTLNRFNFTGRRFSYQGNFGVGYLVMRFDVKEGCTDTYQKLARLQKEKLQSRINGESPYIRLARESLTHYILYGNHLKEIPSYVTEEMRTRRRGVFVSIKKEGGLRGCIGTIEPTTNSIAQEIIRNAVEAGIYDPRFPSVEEEELKELEFSVDVLTEPKQASKEELDPKRYGVIVRCGRKSGLLLPDLEGVDTVEEQLDIALRKAGIAPGSPFTIERFEVIRHKGGEHDL